MDRSAQKRQPANTKSSAAAGEARLVISGCSAVMKGNQKQAAKGLSWPPAKEGHQHSACLCNARADTLSNHLCRSGNVFGKTDPSLNQLRPPLYTESSFLQDPDDFFYVRFAVVKGNDENLPERVVIDAQKPFNRFQGHAYPGFLRSGLATGNAELRLSLRREGQRQQGEGHQQTPEQRKRENRSRPEEPPFLFCHGLS